MDIQNRAATILDEYRKTLDQLEYSRLATLAENIISAPKIFLLAAGRSRCVIQMFAMRLAQAGLRVHLAGEVTTPAITQGELLIVASGSGATRSVLAMAEKATEAGAVINALTATPDTRLTELSAYTLLLPTGKITDTQVLGNFFETSLLLSCDLLIEVLLNRLGQTPADLAARHANIE